MSPRFEKEDTRHVGRASQERDRIHEARWQTRGGRDTTEMDIDADSSMSEIYKDKRQFEQYKKVGFHEHGDNFLRMIEKWEHDKDLTEGERDMREEVRGEFTTRMGIVKSCEKLLTTDVFKGVSDEDAAINRLVGELGADWALKLIKPRLINIVGEDDGTTSLTELWQALRDMHGVYKTKGFNKVYSRIEQYRMKYGITPSKWTEIQKGGDAMEIGARAYGEFQKQHGFLGRAWHAIPNMWHAGKIGLAGWDEEQNSAMQRLRDTRSRALSVLGNLMSEDFQKVIDKVIKTGDKAGSEKIIKQQDEQERKDAEGMTETDMVNLRDTEWQRYSEDMQIGVGHESTFTSDEYDQWNASTFAPKHVASEQAKRTGWLGTLMSRIFSVRSEHIARPSNVLARP